VQNFKPKDAQKMELDYNSLKKFNPKIICGTITGYGDRGPMKDNLGFDTTI